MQGWGASWGGQAATDDRPDSDCVAKHNTSDDIPAQCNLEYIGRVMTGKEAAKSHAERRNESVLRSYL